VVLAKKLDNRELLRGRHFEKVGHVTLRNYEDVTATQRTAIRAHIGQLVLGQYGLRGTDLALLTLFHRSPFAFTTCEPLINRQDR
jgi:hypothetical protein